MHHMISNMNIKTIVRIVDDHRLSKAKLMENAVLNLQSSRNSSKSAEPETSCNSLFNDWFWLMRSLGMSKTSSDKFGPREIP